MSISDFYERNDDYVPPPLYGTEFIGPMPQKWDVVSHGYSVPYLTAIKCENGNVLLSLDGRFLIEGTEEETQKWIPMIANAMAIGAGYSCHGKNSQPLNRFKCGVVNLGLPRLEDS